MAKNGVELRTAAGQRFSRECGKNDNYRQLSTRQKAEFRKQWAVENFQRIKSSKVKSTSLKQTDISRGVYLPFAVIVQKEGNDEQALAAATRYSESCLKLGHPWHKENKFTGRREYLYIRQEYEESFERSWVRSEVCEKSNEGGDMSAPEVNIKMADKQKRLKSGGGKEKQEGEKDKDKTPKIKSDLDLAITRAQRTKTAYASTMSSAGALRNNINKKDDWSWAKGCRLSKELSELLDNLDALGAEPFASSLLASDMKVVKSQFPQHNLLKETLNFSATADPIIEQLGKLVKRMLGMHREALRAD